MMGAKIGLDEVKQEDLSLFIELEKTLRQLQPDMTIFFQLLTNLPFQMEDQEAVVAHFSESFYKDPSAGDAAMLAGWINSYTARIAANRISQEAAVEKMRQANPRFVLRNYLLHQAIEDLQEGNDTLFVKLQEALKTPYADTFDEFFARRPSWASQKAGCSMLSCSS
jgi:uncharacterized protein YdiU (UPF0061 family)